MTEPVEFMSSSNADAIALDVQAREGWTDTTLINVLLDYISNQDSDEAFTDYLHERSSYEPDGNDQPLTPDEVEHEARR
jgi:hypothetical protein